MMSNPEMAQQMQQMVPAAMNMMQGPQAPGAPASGNPMAGMMQQVMSNPEMMQRMMPAAMQMMQNPQAMQQLMQMRQQMGMGGPMGMPMMPGFGMPAAPPASGIAPAADAMSDVVLRARFASQLTELIAMGFTNEAVCLRVLQQHNGRIDAAIDALLSSPDAAQ